MRILWLKTELLHPVDRGGRIRTHGMLTALAKHHEITYLTLAPPTTDEDVRRRAEDYCHRLVTVPFRDVPRRSKRFAWQLARSMASPLPYSLWRYRSTAMRSAIATELGAGRQDVLVCDFLFPTVNLPPSMPIPSVLFQHNVEAMIWRRQAEHAPGRLRRMVYRAQWRRMARYEAAACRRFDLVVAVSEDDRRALKEEYGLPEVDTVPTGVNTAFFTPRRDADRRPHHLVFTGAMDWLPNEDGINFFLAEVFPRIVRAVPEATITIVGRNPSAQLQARAADIRGVTVTGTVPDVRPFLDEASVFVVPLRIGGGTRLKIFEAMAMGLPVVSTRLGAEGLPLTAGQDYLQADDPTAMVEAVVGLLRSPARARHMGTGGRARVEADFGWDAVAQRFAGCCEEAVRRWQAAP